MTPEKRAELICRFHGTLAAGAYCGNCFSVAREIRQAVEAEREQSQAQLKAADELAVAVAREVSERGAPDLEEFMNREACAYATTVFDTLRTALDSYLRLREPAKASQGK